MLARAMHFNGYDPENGPFFDELFRAPGRPRPGLEALVAGIDGLEDGDLKARQRAAEHSLLNLGITFTLNGESGADGSERIFPFDIIPRVITAKEWQRLERGIKQRLEALNLFLADVYGDHDFSRRDADIARVLPKMQRLLPEALLHTLADAIELGALTHALDLRMAAALQRLAPRRRRLDMDLYARAYRACGLPRLRARQIALIAEVGDGLAQALRMRGVATLLRLSRVPARAAGLSELQGFLERGFDAFAALGDAQRFIEEIRREETAFSQALFGARPRA